MVSTDPRRILASWNNSIHFCRWIGVTCAVREHQQRVVSLNLSSFSLAGTLSPSITNLTFLNKIDLSNNLFHGFIPDNIGGLSRLQHMNLRMNSLQGGIPKSLSHCTQLRVITIRDNILEGEIPSGISRCTKLRIINLRNNSLTGNLPPSLSNLSSLSVLILSINRITGNISPSLANHTSLTLLDLEQNQFTGGIPASLGKLSNLTVLDLGNNNLTGEIPSTTWNLSSLSVLYMNSNCRPSFSLTQINCLVCGIIPENIGNLQGLQFLNFLVNLTNCTDLYLLQLDYNNLAGLLPYSVANFSINLQVFTAGNNYISGKFPSDIGNLVNLTTFDIGSNLLTGSIPPSIGMLQNMHVIDFSSNQLSGEIPSTLGNLTQLIMLFLDFNQLSGTIPPNLGKCRNFNVLNLRSNKLTGAIHKEILTITTLTQLTLSFNSLTRNIPSEIGSLINLGVLGLSANNLSGKIPSTLGSCQELLALDLSRNFLEGNIPLALGALKGTEVLNVSQNKFSGRIPDFLQDFQTLYCLNLSFNNFKAEVPKSGVFSNITKVLVVGNKEICGGILEMHLPSCPNESRKQQHSSRKLIVIAPIAGSFTFLILASCLIFTCCRMQKSKQKLENSLSINEQFVKVSYADLVRVTNGFSRENLIGSGSFGAVYKGVVGDDSMQAVAVKVLDPRVKGASKSFVSECKALKDVRHRNVVKIISVCSRIDFRGNDFKAIIYEFMAKGSLDEWLHPRENEQCKVPKKLNLLERLNIAIHVASALDYLHHDGKAPVIHCDLKPSNILLDDDMTGHLSDFGQAKILQEKNSKQSKNSTTSTGLKGTVGYIAPEYGVANKLSNHGDVYSYGILLLEMFTGKRPHDEMFNNGDSLQKFVASAFPERIMDVMDSHLLSGENGKASASTQDRNGSEIECVASIFRIGIRCTHEIPTERMDMGSIIRELHNIKEAFLRK